MPNHNPEDTPPELRRAPNGSRAGRQTVHHTEESFAHLEALSAEWKCREVEVVRRALALARLAQKVRGKVGKKAEAYLKALEEFEAALEKDGKTEKARPGNRREDNR